MISLVVFFIKTACSQRCILSLECDGTAFWIRSRQKKKDSKKHQSFEYIIQYRLSRLDWYIFNLKSVWLHNHPIQTFYFTLHYPFICTQQILHAYTNATQSNNKGNQIFIAWCKCKLLICILLMIFDRWSESSWWANIWKEMWFLFIYWRNTFKNYTHHVSRRHF